MSKGVSKRSAETNRIKNFRLENASASFMLVESKKIFEKHQESSGFDCAEGHFMLYYYITL